MRPDLEKRTASDFAARTKRIKRKRKLESKLSEAKRLWDQHKKTSARKLSVAKLCHMNGDSTRCMYCEHDAAVIKKKNGKELAIVDHWQPQSRAPERTFDWTNHFLACYRCNTTLKIDAFPCDSGGQPLLIHPVDDNPLAHLEYKPGSGEFTQLTAKGDETIKLFQLNDFYEGRRYAWNGLLESLRKYDEAIIQGDRARALEIKHNWLRLEDFRSLLNYLVMIALGPSGDILTGPDIPDIVKRCDPLTTWR